MTWELQSTITSKNRLFIEAIGKSKPTDPGNIQERERKVRTASNGDPDFFRKLLENRKSITNTGLVYVL